MSVVALATVAMGDDPADTYNFLALADWGADHAGQYAAAAGMGAVAEEIGATQVFVLGDNFYSSGLHPTPADPKSEARIKKTYEDVYTAPSLITIPFWVCAGNHDHLGNVTNQIEYSTSPQNLNIASSTTKGATISAGKRWRYPNYWHNVTQHFEVGGKEVELEVLLFDSVIMAGNSDVLHANGSITEVPLHMLQQQTDPLALAQLDWLTDRLASSTADYLWVGGHYPVWAIGQDPPTGVRQVLRDLLNKYEANYFNGHEHDFEHIVEENTKVNYVSTGAGFFCCYADRNLGTVPQNSIKFASSGPGGEMWWGNVTIPDFEILSGFTSYRVGPDSMKVYYHAHNGTVLYTTEPILARTKKVQPPPPPINPFCTDAACPHRERPTV
jgi:hypothetical protein